MVSTKTRLALLSVLLIALTGCGAAAPEMISFAKCLKDKGAVMYGSYTCIHCLNQKERFEGAFSEVAYVECNPNSVKAEVAKCEAAKIEGTPTWIFADGSREAREMELSELGAKTGCSLTTPSGAVEPSTSVSTGTTPLPTITQ